MSETDRPPAPGRIRTSDGEREEMATILRAAMGEGRLTLAEGEERLAAAYAATYRDELTALTADLPGQGRPALARTPQVRAELNRRLAGHAGKIVVVAAILTGLWFLSDAHFFWPAIPLMILVFSFLHRLAAVRRGQWPGHRGGDWRRGDWRAAHHGRPRTG